MRKFKVLGKRVILALLLVSITTGIVSSSSTRVYADSNDRISTFIGLAAGKQTTDLTSGSLNLKKADLQFLGVYISNFFIPFGTELGSTESITVQNKEDITKALQTNLSFSSNMAKSFTEELLGLSRASIQELSIYVSKDYQKDLVKIDNVPLNSYTALSCLTGGWKELLGNYRDKRASNAVIDGVLDGTYKYGYFCYNNNGVSTPVFDFTTDGSRITPSMASFIKCLESADMVNGYGTNFFDFSSSEMGNSSGDYADKIAKIGTDENIAYKMSAYGTKLVVDCFGNIILMGGNHQYIAVPACMNPYTWITVDSDGNSVGQGIGGTAYNMINVPSMSLYDNMSSENKELNVLFTGIADKNNNTKDGVSTAIDPDVCIRLDLQFLNAEASGEVLNAGNISTTNRDVNYLKAIINFSRGVELDNKDLLMTKMGDYYYVSGKATALLKIDSNRLSENNLKNEDDDNVYAVVTDLDELASADKSISKANIVSSLANMSKIANTYLLNGSNINEDNESVGILTQGILSTSVFDTKLSKMSDSRGDLKMRKVRGDADPLLKSTLLLWSFNSDSAELAKLAEKGFRSIYTNAYNFAYGNLGGIGDNSVITVPSGLPSAVNKKVDLLDSFVFTDNLGAANFNSGSQNVYFKALNICNYASGDKPVEATCKSWGSSANNGFSSTYGNIVSGKLSTPEVNAETMIGIYITYAYSYLYDSKSEESKKETIGKLGYKMTSFYPSVPDEALVLSDETVEDIQMSSIRNWLYYLLHPTEGLDYVTTLVKNKGNAILLGWHDDMVGTNGTGSINGTTQYRGIAGYVTVPELSDIPWINSLINIYNQAIPFLIILMILVMIGSYIGGFLPLQKAFIGVVIFSACSLLPATVINSAVWLSNEVSTSMFSDKFTYWALIQHESYSDAIDKSAESGSYESYLKTLYNNNSSININQGSESLMLKWQAPKKMVSLMLTKKDSDVLSGSIGSILSGLINKTYSGEMYLSSDNSYLYRSYIDIANFSRYIHRGLAGTNPVQSSYESLNNSIKDGWSASLRDTVSAYDANYEKDRADGYTNKNEDGSTSGTGANTIRVRLPLSSTIVSEALRQKGTIKDLSINDFVGINQDAFNFSIPMFNVRSLDFLEQLKTDNFNPERYTREDFSGLASYGLMSESVFYYFSWGLYESGLSEEASSNTGYKNLLLGQDNAGYFYNTSGNGELKDFMDMKSLFTYIIPYLKQGNDLVQEWDDTYGLTIYDGVPTEEGHQNDTDIINNKELQQKYWHNLNVARLYNVYTPWVDVMYDCSYSDPEKVVYQGKSVVIQDPINPSSYPSDRPMIFSKSEMVDYGLKENQLTTVERKIISCEIDMQEVMFKLLNYHNFNDVVLNTAASMNCAFIFNKTFSEPSLLGSSHNIYPQSLEVKDFSYDAFLRFILSNSTGESMIVNSSETGFYNRLVAKSSTTTAILLLALDFLAMYVIPWIRMFLIVGLFILGILTILNRAFRVDIEGKFIGNVVTNIFKPTIKFLIISLGMSFIVSLFMGEGNTSVTGSTGASIQLGDPAMVLIAMIVLNVVVTILYVKVLFGVFKGVKSAATKVGGFLSGVAGGVAGMAVGGLISSTRAMNRLDNHNVRRAIEAGYEKREGGSSGAPNERALERTNNIKVVEDKGNRTKYDRDSLAPKNTKNFNQSTKNKRRTDASLSREDINKRTKIGSENIKNRVVGSSSSIPKVKGLSQGKGVSLNKPRSIGKVSPTVKKVKR